jgi:enterochelin esterase-like enzyme
MKIEKPQESYILNSAFLQREVIIDFYFPPEKNSSSDLDLLLINDGQDLITMGFQNILEELYEQEKLKPLLCAGIHCGPDRKNEYGTAKVLNENGLGAKAQLYTRFILEEILPFIKERYQISLREKSFCGFSLGGLSALDIVWNHPKEFLKAGVFSGALWWRSVSQDDKNFVEDKHRIMHNEIRKGNYYPGQKFFFETGTLDETADRNNNGIIDSIDDTISLIDELIEKGYDRKEDIFYLELKDGKHDVNTWGRAFPEFLKWGWGY